MQQTAAFSVLSVLTGSIRPVNYVLGHMNQVSAFNPRRIDRARLEANLSVADVAFGIRRVTNGRLKPTEQSVRRWVRGLHTPREGVVAAIAAVTGHDIAFFYESDDDEEEDPALRRDLQELPIALRRRIERALARKATA